MSAVELLRAAPQSRGAPVDAVVADVTTWRAAAPVDLAVLCYLQLEPDALAAAIARAAEALRPGGVLLGIWHDREDVARGLAGSMTPRIRTTPEETASAAAAAGLVVDLSGRRDRPVTGGLACDALLIAHA